MWMSDVEGAVASTNSPAVKSSCKCPRQPLPFFVEHKIHLCELFQILKYSHVFLFFIYAIQISQHKGWKRHLLSMLTFFKDIAHWNKNHNQKNYSTEKTSFRNTLWHLSLLESWKSDGFMFETTNQSFFFSFFFLFPDKYLAINH